MMDQETPLVSIMISVYNQLHCLNKALESALDQTYNNMEIIISDDFSTDGDVESYLNRYDDPRIKYFRNPKNLGVSGNFRNLLNTYSSGDLALMLNADDYLTDNTFIEKAVNIFTRENEVALVFGDVKILIENSGELISDSSNDAVPKIMNGNSFFLNYWKGYSLPHLTCLYDRQHALSLGFYLSDSISDDLESLFRLVINKKVGHISYPVGVLVRHQQNFTKSVKSYFKDSATDFIDKPYEYALNNTNIEPGILEKWRLKMLRRYYLKILVKLHFLAPDRISDYKLIIKNRHPEVYHKVTKDIRYFLFKMIALQPWLLRFIFKKVFKQESFIADLLQYKD